MIKTSLVFLDYYDSDLNNRMYEALVKYNLYKEATLFRLRHEEINKICSYGEKKDLEIHVDSILIALSRMCGQSEF